MESFAFRKIRLEEKVLFFLVVLCSLNLLLLWGVEKNLFFRQLTFWLLGGGILCLIVRLNFSLENLAGIPWGFYLAQGVLLLLPLVWGKAVRGASRWIFVSNQSFQPSELAKIFFVISLAGFLNRITRGEGKEFLKISILILLPLLLLLFEPNLGTALVFAFTAGVMVLGSRLDKRLLFLSFLLFLPLVFWADNFLLAEYQKERIEAFFDPWSDPLGKGYNLLQAQVAFGSGKIFGRGLGLGGQTRLFFLPERHTDFIFASLGESFGFFGASLLLVSYFFFFFFLWQKAAEEESEFVLLLKTGLVAYLWFQSVVNIAMNLGLLPVGGLPLPLFSYGGSSLVTSLVSVGLILKKR